ncbi:MAG: hypothetical protein ACLQUY_26880 [Ktedonobacterales bacterium]
MRVLRQFWSRGIGSKVVVLAIAGVIVLLVCFGALLVSGTQVGGINANVGSKTTSGAIVGNNTPTATRATEGSPVPTSAQTRVPTATATPGEPPQLGAPLADFIATYGQPTLQQSLAATDDFWGDKQQTILIGVDMTKGQATQITVLGPSSSSSTQTFDSCAAFLPPDASSYNSAPPYTYFNSSIGDLVLDNEGEGLCMLYVASS